MKKSSPSPPSGEQRRALGSVDARPSARTVALEPDTRSTMDSFFLDVQFESFLRSRSLAKGSGMRATGASAAESERPTSERTASAPRTRSDGVADPPVASRRPSVPSPSAQHTHGHKRPRTHAERHAPGPPLTSALSEPRFTASQSSSQPPRSGTWAGPPRGAGAQPTIGSSSQRLSHHSPRGETSEALPRTPQSERAADPRHSSAGTPRGRRALSPMPMVSEPSSGEVRFYS